MIDASRPDAPEGPAAGEEPEEKSGAGYGNHAPDADEPASDKGDAPERRS